MFWMQKWGDFEYSEGFFAEHFLHLKYLFLQMSQGKLHTLITVNLWHQKEGMMPLFFY